MGGRITYVPGPEDVCKTYQGCEGKPPAGMLKPKTQWTCNVCGKIWVVVAGAQYNEPYQAWRKLTNQTRGGFDR